MLKLLTGFIEELRAAGVPVSMVETIDAAQAVRFTDISDRAVFKATLGATLVKNLRHYDAFETVFEVYFGLRPLGVDHPELADARDRFDAALISGGGAGGTGDIGHDALADALYRAIRDGDEALLHAVVRRAVELLAGMEPGRPVGGTYYLYRVLRRLEVEGLVDRLLADISDGEKLATMQERLLREELERRIEQVKTELRSEIRRRLVADRGRAAVARTLRRPLVEDTDLMRATRLELAEIDRVVHPLARKLATRLSRRRKQGRLGRLDVRRTIRSSLSAGGVPVEPKFRAPRPSKPELFILADVSGSVATFARFTMQLVYAISHQFSRVRSFAFIDAIDEVTDYFGPGVDFDRSMEQVGGHADVVWLDGHSDYGNSFAQFWERYGAELTPRSTIIVTGDARSNYHDPNVASLGSIAAAGRALYWLNPESRRYWNTGDSVMSRYAEFCDGVFEVRNLRQLEAFVERVALPSHRRVTRPA